MYLCLSPFCSLDNPFRYMFFYHMGDQQELHKKVDNLSILPIARHFRFDYTLERYSSYYQDLIIGKKDILNMYHLHSVSIFLRMHLHHTLIHSFELFHIHRILCTPLDYSLDTCLLEPECILDEHTLFILCWQRFQHHMIYSYHSRASITLKYKYHVCIISRLPASWCMVDNLNIHHFLITFIKLYI